MYSGDGKMEEKKKMKTNLELSVSLSWISHIPNNPVLGDWLI